MISPIEIIHNHAVGGKIIINNMPIPAPKIHPAIIFLHFLKNISDPPYYILWRFSELCEHQSIDLYNDLWYDEKNK